MARQKRELTARSMDEHFKAQPVGEKWSSIHPLAHPLQPLNLELLSLAGNFGDTALMFEAQLIECMWRKRGGV